MKQYDKKNIPLAKALRRNMTPWERKLWYEFLRQYPIRFQRQKAIGDYIVDFYCAKAKLVVELDGGGHYDPAQIRADERRTAELEHMELSVLRICNLDVDWNFRGVCECIDNAVRQSLPQSALLTAPSSEGALERSTNTPSNQDRRMDRPMAKKRIFALGFFDGVHLGHQALLAACVQLAKQMGVGTAAITFAQHPQSLFTAEPPALINTAADRERLLRHYGMEDVVTLPVTKEVMSTDWETFLRQLLELGAAGFVCGNDFHFGCRGEGDGEKLRSFCAARELPCVIVPDQLLDGIRISSTHIRTLLEQGEAEQAERFLGHPHILTGEVVAGRHIGRTIGVPTANVLFPGDVLIPRTGVYACKAWADGREYLAVTNVGSRPTVHGHQVRTESWLLGFQGDLYGRELTLEFYQFLRPEKKFDSLEELQEEIRKNAEETLKYFEKT